MPSTPYFDAYERGDRSNSYRFEKIKVEQPRLFQELAREIYNIQLMNQTRFNIEMVRISRYPRYSSYVCDPLF